MLLARLKRETKQLHQQIEASLDLFRTDFSLDEYRRLLQGFYGYYAPWEDRVRAVEPELLERRNKSDWLIQDLMYLGLGHAELMDSERCADLPPLNTAAEILGSMYVLEGATLGGQVLRPHIRSRFGLNRRGCDFFTGYGDLTSSMWKEFGALIESRPECDHERIIVSAMTTFESMLAWFSGVPRA